MRFCFCRKNIFLSDRLSAWKEEKMNYIDATAIGQRIRTLRKEKNLTQEKLAELLGIQANSIARIERGLRVPSLELFADISTFFEVSLDYLILGR